MLLHPKQTAKRCNHDYGRHTAHTDFAAAGEPWLALLQGVGRC